MHRRLDQSLQLPSELEVRRSTQSCLRIQLLRFIEEQGPSLFDCDYFRQLTTWWRIQRLPPPSLCRALTGSPLSWRRVRRKVKIRSCRVPRTLRRSTSPRRRTSVTLMTWRESLQQPSELEVKRLTQNCPRIQLLRCLERGRVQFPPFHHCQLRIW